MRYAGWMALGLSCGLAMAQPAFEVAHLKRAEPAPAGAINDGAAMRIDYAQIALRNQTLSTLIQLAYSLPRDRIRGPAWLEDSHWDVAAKLPAGSSRSQVPEMMQTLLAESFRLAVHREPQTRPVYDLVAGKGMLRLKKAADRSAESNCNGGPHHECRNVTMAQLASILTTIWRMSRMVGPTGVAWALDRPVADRTGIDGAFDFAMDYGVGPGNADGDRPVFLLADAVKALGLELKPDRETVSVLVIDRIERQAFEQ